MVKRFILVLAALILTSLISYGQENFIELLRSDLKTQKKAVITEAMNFTEDQAAKFWPIYREYEFEFTKIGDTRVALIKDFANNYENMTDEKAKEITDKALKIEEETFKLKKKYIGKFSKVLPATVVARFLQVENQINNLMNLQIASELPLIEPVGSEQ